MFLIQRRTFLLTSTAVVAGVVINEYIEPFAWLKDLHSWVEDKGDFYIVRVPAFKSFVKEQLDKPTIFLLGEKSSVSDVTVKGFINVAAPRGGLFTKNTVDGSRMNTKEPRSPVFIGNSNELVFAENFIYSTGEGAALTFHNKEKE